MITNNLCGGECQIANNNVSRETFYVENKAEANVCSKAFFCANRAHIYGTYFWKVSCVSKGHKEKKYSEFSEWTLLCGGRNRGG